MRRVWVGACALALALTALVGAQSGPVAGQPFKVAADHPEAEMKLTTGYQLYVSGVRTGPEVAAATAWAAGVVTLTHSGLAAGTYTVAVEAVRRIDGKVLRSRSGALSFTVGPGTEPPPGPAPTLQIPSGLYVRWADTPPPEDSDEGGLISKVVPPVTTSGLSAVLSVGAVDAQQAVVVGISQPGSGIRAYAVTDNLGRAWTRAGVAKFGSADGNTRGSQLWVAPGAATDLTVTVTVDTAGVEFHASAVVVEIGDSDLVGQVTVDPDNTLAHRCGPDPWPMEEAGVVLCLVTLNNTATVTPARGVSLLPGGSSFFAWLANEFEDEDSGTIAFTTNTIRRAATVGVRVR